MYETQQSAVIPEAALIARLRRRDTEALEILMQRHAARVYRVAFGITRNDADAEEVVQDVFLSLFEKIPPSRSGPRWARGSTAWRRTRRCSGAAASGSSWR